MRILISSEIIFYTGIAVLAAAGVLTIVCFVVFMYTGKRLKKQLEQEYGKPVIQAVNIIGRQKSITGSEG